MLQRYIPGLEKATTAAKRWALVMEYTADGFILATKRTESLDGALKVLRNQFDDAAKGLALGLLPNMTAFVKSLTTLLEKYNNLNPAQKTAANYALLFAAAIGPASLLTSGLLSLITLLGKAGAAWRLYHLSSLGPAGIAIGIGWYVGTKGLELAGMHPWKSPGGRWTPKAVGNLGTPGTAEYRTNLDYQEQQLRTQQKISRQLGNGVPVRA